MTTEDQLLRDICTHPEDLSLRLIYADYLEEFHQQVKEPHPLLRAELIRLQILGGDSRREEELLTAYWPFWLHLSQAVIFSWAGTYINGYTVVPGKQVGLHWKNGFAWSFDCSLSQLLAFAVPLFAHHPITEVHLHGKHPQEIDITSSTDRTTRYRYDWWLFTDERLLQEQDHLIPHWLFCHLSRYQKKQEHSWYDSEEEARKDLSRACVNWARQEVDLPPLTSRGDIRDSSSSPDKPSRESIPG